jgi:hypothetical protein
MDHTSDRSETDRAFVGKHEGKRLLRRTRYRRNNNTKTNLEKIRLDGVDWIYPYQEGGGSSSIL